MLRSWTTMWRLPTSQKEFSGLMTQVFDPVLIGLWQKKALFLGIMTEISLELRGVSVLFISFVSVMCWSKPLACSQPLEFISFGGFSVKFEAIRIRWGVGEEVKYIHVSFVTSFCVKFRFRNWGLVEMKHYIVFQAATIEACHIPGIGCEVGPEFQLLSEDISW